MLQITRHKLIEKALIAPYKSGHTRKHVLNDARSGDSIKAIAYLVKKGVLLFPKKQIQKELDLLCRNYQHHKNDTCISINQYNSMTTILFKSAGGKQRVMNFLKKQKRIRVK